MLTRQYGKEVFDFHLFILCFFRKIWIVLLFGVLGGAAFGGVYYLQNITFAPAQKYEIVSDSYMEYVLDVTGEDYTIFNQVTWGKMIYADDIISPLLQEFSITREEAEQSIHATLLSDKRILTTTVEGYDKKIVEQMNAALLVSLQEFGKKQREFIEIRTMMVPEKATIQSLDLRLSNAKVLGIVIGLFFSAFFLILYYIWDDRIYLAEIFEKRYHIPMLGNYGSSLYKKNVEKLLDLKKAHTLVYVDSKEELKNEYSEPLIENMKSIENPWLFPEEINNLIPEQPIVLLVSAKRHNSKLIEATLQLLDKYQCDVCAAILLDSNETLQRMYYFPGSQWMKKHLK